MAVIYLILLHVVINWQNTLLNVQILNATYVNNIPIAVMLYMQLYIYQCLCLI